jgi:hypothetical protein
MAIGHSATSRDLERYLQDMGVAEGDRVPFDTFFEWWTSDVGVRLVQNHSQSPHK